MQVSEKSKSKNKDKQMFKVAVINKYIEKYPGQKIIIYSNSRDDTEELSIAINKKFPDISAAYHAGLGKKKREEVQENFMNGSTRIIIATIAFGMGIDNVVKCVIVFGCPSSIEEYFQQIGRGGRDGQPCETLLFFDTSKYMMIRSMLRKEKNSQMKSKNLELVDRLVSIDTCRRKYILEHFNEISKFFACGNCDNCCKQELIDMTQTFSEILFSNGDFMKKFSLITNHLNRGVPNMSIKEHLMGWYKYIIENKLDIKNLPENLKLRIPRKFLNHEKKVELVETIDDKISKYEKYLA
jgi:superfamily II DNA helicase RecQ